MTSTAATPLQTGQIVELRFPTMLRKMWSGGEVQAWLDALPPMYHSPFAAGVQQTKTANAPELPEAFHPDASHVPPEYRDGWNACHKVFTAAKTRRAFEIADEAMFELLLCHCLAAHERHALLGLVEKSVLGLVDESGVETRTLAQADPAIVESFNWLCARGYVEIGRDNHGEHIVVLHRLGEE
ncbi:MAG: hypothetical protein EPN79_11830 [Burkholderiaceae bacterium]|nr:MAG: hypothetical protein EPN79_11830 [Burkholderiaceae bacterium]TBR76654.1 MAG: hypothetical protein EPN64_05235 [Burkholderiaceae bacterium]